MSALADLIARALAFFYELVPSYGVAIILLTSTIMLAMTPLTVKGTRSMIRMQRLQPQLKEIQQRYRNDRQRMNEELMRFYRENDLSPFSGCLPMLLQIPVFIVLFQVLRGLTIPASTLGVPAGWVLGHVATGREVVAVPDRLLERGFDPAFLDHSSALYRSLVGAKEMPFLGMDLARSPSQALKEGVLPASPYFLLIALVAATTWYQQKQIQGRQTTQMNPQQQTVARVMVLMMPVISFSMPGGLVLYFAASNVFRVGQQAWITRSLALADSSSTKPGTKPGNKKKPAESQPGKGKSEAEVIRTSADGRQPRGSSGLGGKVSGSRKRYTSDPRAKRKLGTQPVIQPRPRKKKRS
ncbi:MAG: hypothetical protein KatS3mg008_1413 [Acidimicrobiales bacterium]|nr:MAG: hypothetical protein KatS3mg008_1413 [Acidimicrobiales bacterium]